MRYLVVVLFSALWSSAFIAGKIGAAELDPFSLLGWRYGVSVLLLLPWAWPRQPGLVSAALTLGLLNNGLYLGLTFAALPLLSPATVIVIVSTAPFLTALLAAALGLERIRPGQVLGMAIGFAGVLLLVGPAALDGASALGVALAGAGTLAFAGGTLFYRRHLLGFAPVTVNFWQSLAGLALLAPLALWWGGAPRAVTTELVLVVLYLALVVTIGGMALWLWLIRSSGAATAASYHLLNPFFAVLLSHLAFGSPVTMVDGVGGALVALGLLLAARVPAASALRPARGSGT